MKFIDFINRKKIIEEALKAKSKVGTDFKPERKSNKKIRKRHRKNYESGTFGVEIEFAAGVNTDNIDNSDLLKHILNTDWRMLEKAKKSWYESEDFYDEHPGYDDIADWEADHEAPENVEEWDENNPEPIEDDFEDRSEWEEAWDSWEFDKKEAEEAYSNWEEERNEMDSNIDHWIDTEDKRLEEYIESTWLNEDGNRWEAIESYQTEHGSGDVDTAIEGAKDLIENHGFSVQGENADKEVWGVGTDGTDDFGRTIVEVRTGIMTIKDINNFREFLDDFADFLNSYETHGTTGLHVHIGGPSIHMGGKTNQKKDFFSILGIALNTDEDSIVDEQKPYYRDYGQWAAKKSTITKTFVKQVLDHFKEINLISSVDIPLGTHVTTIVTNQQLQNIMPLDKHLGVNMNASSETIEFRYLTSELLNSSYSGPDKIVQYIRYFLTLPLAVQNKQRLTVSLKPQLKVVLSRLGFDKIRIDLFNGISKRIPQYQGKVSDLKQPTNPLERQPDTSFQQWISQNPENKEKLKAKHNLPRSNS